jgi:hypothetical protein
MNRSRLVCVTPRLLLHQVILVAALAADYYPFGALVA